MLSIKVIEIWPKFACRVFERRPVTVHVFRLFCILFDPIVAAVNTCLICLNYQTHTRELSPLMTGYTRYVTYPDWLENYIIVYLALFETYASSAANCFVVPHWLANWRRFLYKIHCILLGSERNSMKLRMEAKKSIAMQNLMRLFMGYFYWEYE